MADNVKNEVVRGQNFKFNHESNDMVEAIGFTQESVGDKLDNLIDDLNKLKSGQVSLELEFIQASDLSRDELVLLLLLDLRNG